MEFNEIVKELVEFCHINSLLIMEFRYGTTTQKPYAKVHNYTHFMILEFNGKWVVK